jgi:alkylation response protein AidB-like acyl-CoA dehydrogenase
LYIRGDIDECTIEPDAGSDVANLTCEAKLSEDGKHFIVNGEKKWITNGIWCDYFTTAVRTGGPGMNGVSLLLIERDFGGVTTRRMDCQGVWSSGTTYITFEDVKVPVENLLGKQNQGFKGKLSPEPQLGELERKKKKKKKNKKPMKLTIIL